MAIFFFSLEKNIIFLYRCFYLLFNDLKCDQQYFRILRYRCQNSLIFIWQRFCVPLALLFNSIIWLISCIATDDHKLLNIIDGLAT